MFGPTVQGEGHVIGQLTYFLRFGLCDYKCRMCDSMHAVDPHEVKQNASWLTQENIFAAVMAYWTPRSTPWWTFSGGNPAIHDLYHLTRQMHKYDFEIAVETQGSYWNDWLTAADIVTVSPKGPGMGERLDLNELDKFMNNMRGHPGLNMKVVIFDQRDLEIAALLYERYVMRRHGSPYFFNRNHFYLSLGNPYPPGHTDEQVPLPPPPNVLRDILIGRYLNLLPDIQQHPILCQVKFLPQFHVLLYGNKQGV